MVVPGIRVEDFIELHRSVDNLVVGSSSNAFGVVVVAHEARLP